jgi:hypothetical protein
MGAGASQPGGASATSPKTASTAAPNHHIAIGGLTGITHGAQRHVTWSLYHETGYHTIHLQHGQPQRRCRLHPLHSRI